MRAGIRSRPWAGLDVGSYSVKLLASQGGVAGARYWMAETQLPPPDGEPDVVHGKETVARGIADCLSQAGFSALERDIIAFAYQFGSLILPAVVPAVAWVLTHRAFLERLKVGTQR